MATVIYSATLKIKSLFGQKLDVWHRAKYSPCNVGFLGSNFVAVAQIIFRPYVLTSSRILYIFCIDISDAKNNSILLIRTSALQNPLELLLQKPYILRSHVTTSSVSDFPTFHTSAKLPQDPNICYQWNDARVN